MIKEYPIEELDKALATKTSPKHIWINGDTVIVYTGADIPPPPTEQQ